MANEGVREAISRQVEANWEEQLAVTRDTVRIESVTGNEGRMQEYMAALYRRLGLRVVTLVADKEQI